MARRDIDRLLKNDGIIRSRAKIEAAIKGARLWLEIEERSPAASATSSGSMSTASPQINRFKSRDQIPAQSEMSEGLARDLKQRGFNFCGPVIVYAFAQAVGMVNDHVVELLPPCGMRQAGPALISHVDPAAPGTAMTPIIIWFRRDLRLADNPALLLCRREPGGRLFVFMCWMTKRKAPGNGAARPRWWLHHSLTALDKSLIRHGGKLVLRRGHADQVLPAVIRESDADMVAWNRCYEPYAVARDTALKASLAQAGVAVESFNGALLFEPWEITSREGRPFRVFTPFWRALNAEDGAGPA